MAPRNVRLNAFFFSFFKARFLQNWEGDSGCFLVTVKAGCPRKPGLAHRQAALHAATPSVEELEEGVATHLPVAQREDLLDLGSEQKLLTCFYCRITTRQASLGDKSPGSSRLCRASRRTHKLKGKGHEDNLSGS